MKAIGREEDGLYVMRIHCKEAGINEAKSVAVEQMMELEVWHKRLEHVPMATIRKLFALRNKDAFQLQYCDVCPLSRQTRLLFSVSTSRADEPFYLIHMDT